jgi:hypothetical protein
LTYEKPAKDPKLNCEVVVPDPVLVVVVLLFVSVMVRLMPPLTAIEMLDTAWPPRLNCAQETVVPRSPNAMVAVVQFSIKVLADAISLNSKTGKATNKFLTTRFIDPPTVRRYLESQPTAMRCHTEEELGIMRRLAAN